MRLKGYYLFAATEPGCLGPESGVERKVRAQCAALQRYVDCELIILPEASFTNSLGEKLRRRLPYTASWQKWDYRGEFDDADFLYMRMAHQDYALQRYFKAIRRSNPNIKIIYEVPTYPIGGKYSLSPSSISFDLKEMAFRRHVSRLVDRIVTFYGQEEIWGTPCIRAMNGFDFSQIVLPSRDQPSEVHLLSVAAVAPVHGYERLIEGLHQYYAHGNTEQVFYHYVGPARPEHRQLVKDYCLDSRVIFHGPQYGEALSELYRISNLGVDVLGGYKRDYVVSSSLKSREYAAYGLPILTAAPIDYLPEEYPFAMVIPNDPSPVDIDAVLRFYHRIYDGKDVNAVGEQIRGYACSQCDMTVAMKPVADWILQNCTTK